MQFLATTLFLLLQSSNLASALPNSDATTYVLPPRKLSNGAVNPFFPCGLTSADCPYRCYALPNPAKNSTIDGRSKLQPQCYSKSQAAALISDTTIKYSCVQCVKPNSAEIPSSASAPPTCQPLASYYNSTSTNGERPARCATRADPIAACAWDCAAAQVPFDSCDYKNTTGTYRLCDKCLNQCSSPAIVGLGAAPAPNFSIQEGSCGTSSQTVKNTVCPWRCQQAGDSDIKNNYSSFLFCSLVDKTNSNYFTNCTRCA